MKVCHHVEGHEVALNVIRGMILGGMSPNDVLTGLHNAFAFGQILEDADIAWEPGENDENLGAWFEAIEKLQEVTRNMIEE